jgi:hypothetical protein
MAEPGWRSGAAGIIDEAMPLPRPASPRALFADLRAFTAQRTRHQWIAMFLAGAIPATILVVFWLDARTNVQPAAQIVYVESWSADRTDAQIRADQQRREQERRRADAERQRQWKALGDRLGMDP